MNIYRATFYGSNGESFKTLIQGEDIEAVKTAVGETINSGGHFEVEGKGNRYFYANPKNVVFIEYEFLLDSKNSESGFSAFLKNEDAYIKEVLNNVHSITAIAVALAHSEEEEKERIISLLSKSRQGKLRKEIKSIWKVSMSEAYAAQEIILTIAENVNIIPEVAFKAKK